MIDSVASRESEWHNRRYHGGGDLRASSFVRHAYSSCVYASEQFESLQHYTGTRVLDIGCGRGIERAKKFLHQDCLYTGVDISDQCIEANLKDCKRSNLNARFLCDDANSLSKLKGEEFDLIILNGTLHHLDLNRALPRIHDITDKHGSVLMWEPLGMNPVLNIFRILTPSLRTPDEHPLSFDDLRAIKNIFPYSNFQFHTLTATAVLPIALLPSRRAHNLAIFLGRLLGRLDVALTCLPFAKRLCWIVIIESRPK